MLNRLNIIFLSYLAFVALIICGILPRFLVLYVSFAITAYFLLAPLEELILFFVRSIPFFIAMPLTAGFDSFNIWRILSIILFLRWLDLKKIKSFFNFNKNRNVYFALVTLSFFAVLSITQATGYLLSIKRIIFFINLSLIGIIVYDFASRDKSFVSKLIPNIVIPTIMVAVIGMIQLLSTYFLDIFQFVDFWGGVVERNLFGNVWADTALKANTWFAYFGDRLSLRMFSVFPDSHSFPIFLILGLPAILAISLSKVVNAEKGLKSMLFTRGRMLILFVPIAFLGVILSGTRGMWAAGLVSAILAIFMIFGLFKRRLDNYHQNAFKYIASYLSIFFLLFLVAYPIFDSPQFNLFKSSGDLLSRRVRSIFDISETSNSRRIQIWKDSVRSIIKHPLLGVGIGNFPVVVNEDLARVKAGSSAHNLYLNIAAEMGVPALLAALYFLWLLLKKIYKIFRDENNPMLLIYFASSLIFIPWNLLYSFTDVAIFDERTFLLFLVTAGLIFGNKRGSVA
jgi:O-antigen ligase